MRVNLCYELSENPKGFRVIKKEMSVKEAEQYFKKHLDSPEIKKAWLRYFDGWRYRTKKILK